MKDIFSVSVEFVGPFVDEFINEGILVFFGQDAPKELKEFSIIWNFSGYERPIEAGDLLHINDQTFKILGVGEIANKNLNDLGHLIIKFNGETETRLPGDVNVEHKPIPSIAKGTSIRVKGK
ncbi:MAG: PTS glucitol/sorbitol transporter subunit IIA [Chloroflexi bacterium]|nr:PTS glucitol/sorbitol transporter subunit IIA [Chloroflexota bacterium]